MKTLPLAARTLRRELRQRDLVTLALALVLAVLALGAVATLSVRVERSILASAAELIGGDAGISARSALPATFAAEAQRRGLRSSASADFPNVLFANGKSQLADIRAADAAYPLRGELRVRDASGAERSAQAPPAGEAWVEHRLLAALDLKVGDDLAFGGRTLKIGAEILREPGGGEFFALAPRALVALSDADASGLLGAGSRARYRLMVAGAQSAVADYTAYLKAHLPDNAELITVDQAQQNVRSAFERSEAFLRLAALLAALLSGIAVALAARRYARRKTDEVALLRCLGASRSEVFASTTLVLVLLALPACLLGALLGLVLQDIVFAFARDLLPATAAATPLQPSLIAFAIGLAVLFGFALPPLLRLREVPPIRVFQRAVSAQPRRFDAWYLLPVGVSAALIYAASTTLTLATVLAVSLAGVSAFALASGALLIRFARSLRTPGALRFGVANLARRRTLSLLQITALALALTALDLLAVVGPSLLASWRAELPPDTPNYFLINLQPEQRASVLERLQAAGAHNVSAMPMAVGKLVAINGKAPQVKDYEDRRAAGWIRGETRLSWSAYLPPTNRVIAGRWFDAHPAQPEVSIDEMWVEMFHLKLGDTLTLRIADRDVDARVTSVRGVRWDSFRVNFFLLVDPDTGSRLAHSVIVSFHLDAARADALAALAHDQPTLSLIDINALLDRVREIVAKVSRAALAVLGFSLAAGILVLFAALAASADERRFESALLRTLGADRRQITAAVLGEFAVVGALSAVIAAIGAGGAGTWLAHRVFRIAAYTPPLAPLAASVVIAAVVIALAGVLGLRRITRASPLLVLRRA